MGGESLNRTVVLSYSGIHAGRLNCFDLSEHLNNFYNTRSMKMHQTVLAQSLLVNIFVAITPES